MESIVFKQLIWRTRRDAHYASKEVFVWRYAPSIRSIFRFSREFALAGQTDALSAHVQSK